MTTSETGAPVLSGPAASQPAAHAALGSNSLRAWFAFYLLWLGMLTVGALVAFAAMEHGMPAGLPLWAICLGTFYVSLANGILPLPAMWMIMLLASDVVGLPGSPIVRVAVVATITAVATGMANLNEYHVLQWALGGRVGGKVTNTRLMQWAIRWFRIRPFWILTVAAVAPIPIDAIRWVAIADRYNRLRFFWAYFVGRWARYALLAGATVWLHAGMKTIIGVQAALLLIAAVPVVARILRKRLESAGQPAAVGN